MLKNCICRELNLSNSTEFYGHFVFTSLEVGEGITLGNMIRRTLLSGLSGSKIVGVKLLNVNHEFCEIEGVREDVLEILLNLKEVIIKNDVGYRSCYGRINLQGPCIVTAGCFVLPEGIKIINPNHYLFTIVDKISFDIEVKIEIGKSYVLATERKLDHLGEFFPIDANFNPVVNVEYHIQPIVDYVEQSQEELHMIIYTNGTLLPQEALLLATNNLSRLILGCRNIQLTDFEGNSRESLKVTSQIDKNVHTSKPSTIKILNNSLLQKKVNKINSTDLKFRTSPNIENVQSLQYSGKKKFKTNISENKLNSDVIQTATKTIDLKTIDIEITCLPPRIIAILRKAKINVMAELLKYSLIDLQKIRGLGPISVKKIKTQVNLFFEAINL